MSAVAQLNALYDQYAEKYLAVWKESAPLSRVFDVGSTPRNHPCHMEFLESLGRWTEAFLQSDPSYSDLLSVTHWLLKASEAKESPTGGPVWVLYAAQGMAKPMIPLLQSEDRAELRQAYDQLFPARKRLPVQKEVYRLLKK